MRKARDRSWWVLPWAALVVTACSGDSIAQRPEIRFGEHECDRCRMIISEARFAAVALADGEERRFDDLECLVRWVGDSGALDAPIWVHDYAGTRWIAGENAVFVRVSGVVTPMGSGWLAFADSAEASRLGGVVEGPIDWPRFREGSNEDLGGASPRRPL